MAIQYKPYRLSRVISVPDLVSADYIHGVFPCLSPHLHQNAWEMCICLGGQLMVLRGDRYIPLSPGELMLIHPQTQHGIVSDLPGSEAFVISFTCSNDTLRPLQDLVIPFKEDWRELLMKLIAELKASFFQTEGELRLFSFVRNDKAQMGAEQMICTYMEQLLILLLRGVTMHQGKIITEGRLRDAMQTVLVEQVSAYIRDNISRRLTVEEIVEHFHYSRTRLSILFKDIMGVGIGEYITYTRISLAKIMLLEQKKTVAQISEDLGYTTPQYFSRKFAAVTGCIPSAYAEMVRNPKRRSLPEEADPPKIPSDIKKRQHEEEIT